MKNVLLAVVQFRRQRGRRVWQGGEAFYLGVGKCDVVENKAYLLPGVKSCRELNAVTQAKFDPRRKWTASSLRRYERSRNGSWPLRA